MHPPSIPIWKEKKPINSLNPIEISTALRVIPLYGKLMANRGVSPDVAKSFFNPDLTHLHDPMRMQGMKAAVDRIIQAINDKQSIMVYGDYDVDGTTGVSLFYLFLKKVHENVTYYIPDRYTEGYGLSKQGIDTAAGNGCKLMIVIDCGIRSVALIDYANAIGVDIIVCDHHLPGNEIPKAIAVLDPKKPECNYPFKELSGCGIAFKLAQALNQSTDYWPTDYCFKFLDLVAVSTGCDIVPIVGENRILSHFGLELLNTKPRPGLKILMFGVEKDATHSFSISDVVFRIGPRINAAGRLESGLSAVDLLVTDDAKLCEEYASKLSMLNTARGELDVEMTAEAFQQIDKDPDYPNKHTTVVYQPHWHKGVVGIVASRLIERYYRPTLVLTDADDLIGGSARSIETVDVHEALTACESLLVQFGGHRHAAGLKLKKENLLEFSRMFEQAVASKITAKDLHPVFAYESELDLSEINERIIQVIQRFAPFGPQNMEPVFMAKGVYDSGYAKTMGSKHEHLRLNLMSAASSDPISAIAFKMGDWYPKIKNNQRFDILYTIGVNHFNGEKRMQLEIKDIRHPQ